MLPRVPFAFIEEKQMKYRRFLDSTIASLETPDLNTKIDEALSVLRYFKNEQSDLEGNTEVLRRLALIKQTLEDSLNPSWLEKSLALIDPVSLNHSILTIIY